MSTVFYGTNRKDKINSDASSIFGLAGNDIITGGSAAQIIDGATPDANQKLHHQCQNLVRPNAPREHPLGLGRAIS